MVENAMDVNIGPAIFVIGYEGNFYCPCISQATSLYCVLLGVGISLRGSGAG